MPHRREIDFRHSKLGGIITISRPNGRFGNLLSDGRDIDETFGARMKAARSLNAAKPWREEIDERE